MPGENIQDWSQTAANNANSDTLINWQEGQARATVNNSARSMMAAHAKDRDLQNGSIVTTGSANAQAFVSPLGYTAVPTGLRVLLKIGSGLDNTGAATLDMDAIGAVAIKTRSGNDLGGGELRGGQFAELIYDGTFWVLLSAIDAPVKSSAGKLTYASSTLLAFTPHNGGKIIINGVPYDIPAAGITGLANTNVYVNGVAGQNLSASVLYYIYAFNNGGVITADFSTVAHATSGTVGNIGTEIKSGDDSRSLIGICRTGTGGIFVNSTTQRFVRSWFNRDQAPTTNAFTTDRPSGFTSFVEINVEVRINTLLWSDEAWHVMSQGNITNSSTNQNTTSSIGIDQTTPNSGIPNAVILPSIAGQYFPFGLSYIHASLAEGLHYATIVGSVTGATGTWRSGSGLTGHVVRKLA